MPHELRGWNWGAFALSWIWGFANRTYVALFVFVPVIGWFIVPFVLGAKGNAWAWRNRAWESPEHFRRVQRSWARYALIAYGAAAVSLVVVFSSVSLSLQRSEAFALATAKLAQDPRVEATIGRPFETGWPSGDINLAGGGSGTSNLAFSLTGPKGQGKAYVTAKQELGRWELQQVELELADSRRIALHAPAPPKQEPVVQAQAAPSSPPPAARYQAAAPSRALQISAESTDVGGGLPRKRVEQLIERHRNELRYCFAAQGAEPARTTIDFTVLASGDVAGATVPGQRDEALASCLTSAVTRWSFPAPKVGGSGHVRHTFSVTAH